MVVPDKGSAPAASPPAATRRMAVIIGGGLATLAALFLLTGQPESAANLHRQAAAAHMAPPPALLKTDARPAPNYSALLRRNLFQPLVTSDTRKRLTSLAGGTLLPAVPGGLQALQAANPPAGWSYIGSATVDGVPFALLQKGDDYGYYRAGESLDGYVIQSIGSSSLVLAGPAAAPVRLPKTSGAPAVPASGTPGGGAPAVAAGGDNAAPGGTPVVNGTNVGAPAPATVDSAATPGTPDAGANPFGQFRRGRRGGAGGGGGRRQRQNGFQGNGFQGNGFQGNGMTFMSRPGRAIGEDRANDKT